MTKQTPLYNTHINLGGKMVTFAGYQLPIQYSKGIVFEHKAVRNNVGLFDVSHMGEILIQGKGASLQLQKLMTNRVDTIKDNQCRYSLMLYENGTIVDDLLIYKIDNENYLLVVNAANTQKDYEHILKYIDKEGASVTNISDDIAQLALQGPNAYKVLSKLTDIEKLANKSYYFTCDVLVGGIKCLVSTTGYTGESGYELYCKASEVESLYDKIMEAGREHDIEPIGLGARDTLRFECSMPLYGHELSDKIMANEVGLDMFIKMELDFIGKQALKNHTPQYERIGLKLLDKGIARENNEVFDENGQSIGYTTSGGVCITLGGAYAMARVKKGFEGRAYIDVRGRKLLAEKIAMPFYKKEK
ncbi:MAG: glycine cleavage system aminomethyltransferase GcvT [Clostridiales bacterium]|nr:glycine cleavage system aminomethyltransferase GcvT [Clostridiales bacterium]